MHRLLGAVFLGGTVAAQAWSGVVTNAADSGPGTLRQMILNANNVVEPATVTFAIARPTPVTINLVSALPPITNAMVIDATTQPGYAGRPVVELNGSGVPFRSDGLLIRGGNTTIRGLAINRFPGDGIRMEQNGTNRIEGNFLGTDPTGTLDRGNTDGGVAVVGSSGNWIGGTTPGRGNLISGHNTHGIYIVGFSSVSNVVVGNLIGTDTTGRNRLGSLNNGIVVSDGAFNVIGGTTTGERNVISGNGQSGVYIQGSFALSNRVVGNFLGTDIAGSSRVSNTYDGITIYGASFSMVGGTAAGEGNLISGNGQRGVMLNAVSAVSNLVQGNRIGTDLSGTVALGNGAAGVAIVDAGSNLIGGFLALARNVIAGNSQSGVTISGAGAKANTVAGNYIGTDANGLTALSNGYHGVLLAGGVSNVIGGAEAGARNVISGNGQNGIYIGDPSAIGNRVAGNVVGLTVNGQAKLPNRFAGIRLESSGNRLGGTTPAERNVISGNVQSGIYMVGSSVSNNVVLGNFIGTDLAGTAVQGNGIMGINLSNVVWNTIGGVLEGSANVISGNSNSGVFMSGAGTIGNTVAGNLIGTDVSGLVGLGNGDDGVAIYDGKTNTVGGNVSQARNVISANQADGIFVTGAGAVGNYFAGNWIGLSMDGVTGLGNSWHGLEFDSGASHNVVGGTPAAGNRIAFAQSAGFDGVRIRAGSTGILVRHNAIWANGGSSANGLGIDLGTDGVTLNDDGDGDEGANRQQNFPVVTNAIGFATTVVQGMLKSQASRTYTVDLYVSSAADASGYGEGQEWLGAFTVTTAASGTALFTNTWPSLLPRTGVLTATATDVEGNTSEFSAPRSISPGVVATSPIYTCARGRTLRIAVSSVASNETNGPLTVQVGTSSQGVTTTTDQTYLYYTPTNQNRDSFPYTVRNAFGASATGTITIEVVNDGGFAQSITRSGTSVIIQFVGVFSTVYDVQRSSTLTNWTIVSTVTAPADGRFRFTETPPTNPAFYRLRQH